MNTTTRTRYNPLRVCLLCVFLLFTICDAHARDVSFSWNANSEQITGYKLHYKIGESPPPPFDGTGINNSNSPIILGELTKYTVTGLSPDQTYHFALSAYNNEVESDLTAIITIYPDPSPEILQILVSPE